MLTFAKHCQLCHDSPKQCAHHITSTTVTTNCPEVFTDFLQYGQGAARVTDTCCPTVRDAGVAHPDFFAQEMLEQALNRLYWSVVGGPFLLKGGIPKTSQADASVGQLLPVFVAPTGVNGSRQLNFCCRSTGKHLKSRRPNPARQFWQQQLELAIYATITFLQRIRRVLGTHFMP